MSQSDVYNVEILSKSDVCNTSNNTNNKEVLSAVGNTEQIFQSPVCNIQFMSQSDVCSKRHMPQ
jgi:hypothetical protein